jgi:hypothetical protein
LLQDRVLAQFDRLVETKELLWTEVPPRLVASVPFDVSVSSLLGFDTANTF